MTSADSGSAPAPGGGQPGNDVGVVLAAGGLGRRYGERKQFLELAGKPVIHACLDVFSAVAGVGEIVVVCPADDLERARSLGERWRESMEASGAAVPVRLETVAGGERRQDSVANGLSTLSGAIEWALVHDAARPLVRHVDVERVIEAMRRHGAATIGTPCHDSVKRVDGDRIVGELRREEIWTVQTPQGARLAVLRGAYQAAAGEDWTDESSVLRHAGQSVVVVEGSRENLKITRPGDDLLVAGVLRGRGTN